MAAPTMFASPLMPGSYPPEFLVEGMREWFELEAKSPANYVGDIFNVRPSKKASEYEWSVVGFGLHRARLAGTAPTPTERGKAYKSTFTHVTYSLETSTEQEAIDDDQYGWITLQRNSQGLAKSAKRTKSHHAVAALEGGFTTAWNSTEAAYLFSDQHPLAPGAVTPPSPHTAGYGSNLVSSALSISAVQEGLEKLKTCPDARGEPMDLTEDGVTLFVPTVLGFLAHQIVESPGLYNSPNLSINTLKGKLTIVEIPLLASSTQWYLRAGLSMTKGFWFEREQPNTEQEYSARLRTYTQVSNMRYSLGFSDWRGWIGGKPA
ncbi:MAG TPA: hypothetical protein PLE61_15620 [Vicinamibacterales bacterium]|nr:hypothetical protein [Vicinamibacterales bacterium]